MRRFRVHLSDETEQWVSFGADEMEGDDEPDEAARELADPKGWTSIWGEPEVEAIEVSDDEGASWIDYAKAGPPPTGSQ